MVPVDPVPRSTDNPEKDANPRTGIPAMRTVLILVGWTLLTVLRPCSSAAADTEELDPAYYHTGELAGSLRSAEPPPLFDANPQHLWNRIFAAVTIRPSLLPSRR